MNKRGGRERDRKGEGGVGKEGEGGKGVLALLKSVSLQNWSWRHCLASSPVTVNETLCSESYHCTMRSRHICSQSQSST